MELITPELALIDPELAERARSRLPIPRDCLAPRPWPEPRVEVQPPVESRIARRPSLLVAVLALCVAALIGTPTLRHSASGEPAGGVPPSSADAPSGVVPTGGSPLSPLTGPVSGGACGAATPGS